MPLRAVVSAVFAASSMGAAQAQHGVTEVRQQLEALLPSARIDDGDVRRMLDLPAWTACRSVAVLWAADKEASAAAAGDGSLRLTATSRCREPYDLRASARIGGDGLLIAAVDGAGAATFEIEFPGDRRIARLVVYELRRDAGARAPIWLGSVEVPKP